jgi:hypothetical protein
MRHIKPQYEFSADKNQQLIRERSISFEDVIVAIDGGAVLEIVPHLHRAKYPNQEIYVVSINDYVYLVPFVKKDEGTVFLKTVFHNQKLNKQYLSGDQHEKKKT